MLLDVVVVQTVALQGRCILFLFLFNFLLACTKNKAITLVGNQVFAQLLHFGILCGPRVRL